MNTQPLDAHPGLAAMGLSSAIAAVAERVRHSVVTVRSRAGGGAGTVWRAGGLIVTNSHVAPGDRAEVVAGETVLAAAVVARDAHRDLALLCVDAPGLRPAEIGDSHAVRVGELVIAIGNPWGQPGVVTAGVVLAKGRMTAEDQAPIDDAIRADLRLAPGNSGGPLADARGRVIGINAMVAGGVAIAIPSAMVEDFLAFGEHTPGVLGIAVQPTPLPAAIAESAPGEPAGLLVTDVVPGSAAEAAGFIPGDLLIGLGAAEPGLERLVSALRALRVGEPVTFRVWRAGALRDIVAVPAAA